MMESRRRQKRDNCRRPQDRRPPRSTWQPTVPSWEKQFCKVVGTMNWKELLQMKRFTHIYEDIINWDDSAGEEAFSNAKKRFWAQINGLPCEIPLPDPDLYIDEIIWDEEIDPELLSDLECTNVISNVEEDHEPVVIFGDSLLASQTYPPQGWGDIEDNINQPCAPTGWGDIEDNINQPYAPTGWGDIEDNVNQPYAPTGWGDTDNDFNQVQPNFSSTNPWEQNWGDPFNNRTAIGWPVYTNYAWQYSDGSGQMAWEGGWYTDWEWNNANTNFNYEVGPSS